MRVVCSILFGSVVAAPDKAILWLHALGDSPERRDESYGDMSRGWVVELEEMKFGPTVKLVLPQAPLQKVGCRSGALKNSWFNVEKLPITPSSSSSSVEDLDNGRQIVYDEIKKLNDEGIPNENIVVGGFSQGASMALYTTYSGQEKFAGCVCVSGWFQEAMKEKIAVSPAGVKSTPLFWGHGDQDQWVEFSNQAAGVENLNRLSVNNVQTFCAEGAKHCPSPQELEYIKAFIVKQLAL